MSLENKEYCSAVFLDVRQAFDRVCHNRLLCKLKKVLPTPYYLLLRSYLEKRTFYVSCDGEKSAVKQARSGVPQGSVLGPILYTLFTANLPIARDDRLLVATYADDTALLANHHDPVVASDVIQNSLQRIEAWSKRWNIGINSEKSTHVTFSLRPENCPPVTIEQQVIPHHN